MPASSSSTYTPQFRPDYLLVPVIEPGALAYALARLGESLFYVEVLAARKPDMAAASRLQQALIEGILP